MNFDGDYVLGLAFAREGQQVLLILIKPRIIIQREIEQENFPLLGPPA